MIRPKILSHSASIRLAERPTVPSAFCPLNVHLCCTCQSWDGGAGLPGMETSPIGERSAPEARASNQLSSQT